MKTIRVKTLFNGMVAFPEKYYRLGATVKVGNETMKIVDKPVGYGEWMDDKFGRGKYRLCYLNWKPDKVSAKQTKLEMAWAKYNSLSEADKSKYY